MPMNNDEYQPPCQTCKHKYQLTVQEPCWSCIRPEALALPKYGDNTYTNYEPEEEETC